MFRVGSSAPPSRVSYSGAQRLLVGRDGRSTQYDAQASYTRDGDGVKRRIDARFVQELLPDGSFEDRIDDDPDFLTVLNQPFAIRLDAATLRDLRGLRTPVPFDASSPLGGEAVLRGFLRPAAGGKICGRPDGRGRLRSRWADDGADAVAFRRHDVGAHANGRNRLLFAGRRDAAGPRRNPDDRRAIARRDDDGSGQSRVSPVHSRDRDGSRPC